MRTKFEEHFKISIKTKGRFTLENSIGPYDASTILY